MSYIINGKVKRNTTEQVLENAKDIIDLQSSLATTDRAVEEVNQRIDDVETQIAAMDPVVKTATPNIVYGNGSNGDATEYPISVTGSPTAGSIATFDASGRLQSLSPTSNSDVATKQYVDSHSSSSHLYMHQVRINLNNSYNSHVYTVLYSGNNTPYTSLDDFPYNSNDFTGNYPISGYIANAGDYGAATYLYIDFMVGKSYTFYFANTTGSESQYYYNGWETEDPSPSIDHDSVVQIF